MGKTFRWWTVLLSTIWLIIGIPAVSIGNMVSQFDLFFSIVLSSGITLFLPFLLSIKFFRKHFYWPDAMNDKQRKMWQSGKTLESYMIALSDENYTSNLKPYIFKLGILGLVIGLIETGNKTLDVMLIWCLFSIFPVLVTIIISVPYRPFVNIAKLLKNK